MPTHGITKEEMVEALDNALNNRRCVDDDIHRHDHEFIRMIREREERRVKLVTKFKMSLVGSLAMGVVGGLTWLGGLIIESFKHGNH